MGKKNRREKQETNKQNQQSADVGVVQPTYSNVDQPIEDSKYLTWNWYGKIFGGCIVFSGILFLIFVFVMKSISRSYTEDGIAMYHMAKALQAQKNVDADTITGELTALDAVVDIEKLKGFLLSDVAYRSTIDEDTKAWLRLQDQEYAQLQEHLSGVAAFNDVQRKIRDKTIDKIGEIRECVREVLASTDMQDRKDFRKKVVRLVKKIGSLSWYSQIAAGFFSWPSALDAAERSFFEALRFWQQNQEAAYWWGKTLEETAIMDVAAEKKIMAIKFDPSSSLSETILTEFKAAYDANPTQPRVAYNYAFALYRKGHIDEAIPLFRKIHQLDPQMNTFEGFLAKRRLDIIERKIDMRWYKTDDF